MGHYCGTLLQGTLVGNSCRAFLSHSCGRTLLSDTLVGTLVGFCRTGLVCKSQLLCLQAPKVTPQVRKTSVSYETSSKIHSSSLQNKRFARDFLKTSHLKSAKQAFRTRPPPTVTHQVCKTSVSYETSSKSHASSLQNERFESSKSVL